MNCLPKSENKVVTGFDSEQRAMIDQGILHIRGAQDSISTLGLDLAEYLLDLSILEIASKLPRSTTKNTEAAPAHEDAGDHASLLKMPADE